LNDEKTDLIEIHLVLNINKHPSTTKDASTAEPSTPKNPALAEPSTPKNTSTTKPSTPRHSSIAGNF
jgi:hypothetical protein